ncbi:hypothetical protein H5410_035992 [Solanum commersonii]|uniref:Uncharacterized protein n=1 Tax=Solanum commersonii TaxID=4109 RepID=A0A9J5Y583_SOLCO|nr:hypothetical protein H5410_035992 [Solanum commersonii]
MKAGERWQVQSEINLQITRHFNGNQGVVALEDDLTINHLFLHCKDIEKLWKYFINLRGIAWTMPRNTAEVLACWYRDGNQPRHKERWKIVPACIWWIIWSVRNQRCFENRSIPFQSNKMNCLVTFYFWCIHTIPKDPGDITLFLDSNLPPLVTQTHNLKVLDALVSLFCRSNISAETLWDGGWLLRQLLPYSKADFRSHHLELLKSMSLAAIEASSPRKDPKSMLLPAHKSLSEEVASGESSFAAGERLFEIVKVFVLLHQLHIFSEGKLLPDQPPIHPTVDVMETSRAKRAGIDSLGPKQSTELSLVDAVPCRIAFERGKERHFHFLAITIGTSGWLILADELPVRPSFGVVRVVAPLGGCNPRIDEKHMRWLHLRIRPSSFPCIDGAKHTAHPKVKSKALVDGRWTLAFRDEDSCKAAFSMIVEELKLLSSEVERRIKPMLVIERTIDTSTK